ncbi:hypothetical protein BDY19DRAFT_909340 [Irpex rosettiformis]|uniref:Uncharacterized protein n=1 Tax=Irpex rosettiformis TaxID=378272 RepID=A0ACB8TSY5_9APHY|nr:hypothetical protein BDY19DRAFT_909340 [Irpex rosettiformis]
MFPMLQYLQVIPTMASPRSITKRLDSTGQEKLEREDILKLVKRRGINAIHNIRRFFTKCQRGARSILSNTNTTALQVDEAAAGIEFDAMEKEDFSTVGEQSDESSSVTILEGKEVCNHSPRVIYRETEAQRIIDEDLYLPLLPAIIARSNDEPVYTTVHGAIWPTWAVYQPDGYTQIASGPASKLSMMPYDL